MMLLQHRLECKSGGLEVIFLSYRGEFLFQQAGFSMLNCQKSNSAHKHGWLGRGTFSIVRRVTRQQTGMRALASVDAPHQH